ncbi:NAD-dependent epimerase/dehydratase family protein [Candidatus Pelagibacter bacterium nBUS_32]|uniref:NAD-dependent epimerase/dehydratase family protein n=1 Tax=Candidatus Pelagibacter bacterium nBUS_32 TaxID=3374192 RepID=UPI003EB809B0
MKKKILIIGSGGNIGQYIYNNLDKNKYLIFGIEKENNLKKNIFNFKKILKKNISFDTIIHAAGVNPTKFSKKKNFQIYNENKIINDNCLKIINKKKSNKVIFLSSFSVYKKNKYINEASNLENNNLYAKSKIEFEQQLLNLKNSVYILRLCSVVGLGTKNNWLTEIYNTVQDDKKVVLFNKNNNFNNCFDIEDLNLVINKIIKKKSKLKKIYNCASNNNIKIKYIKKILDKNKKFTNKVSFKSNKNLKEFYNDSSKIQKDLKIKFKNTKEIIEKYFSLNVKKKVFIIGSKGYIGSNLSKNLKKS